MKSECLCYAVLVLALGCGDAFEAAQAAPLVGLGRGGCRIGGIKRFR